MADPSNTGRPNGITDRKYHFWIHYAFHSRYRYRRKLVLHSFFVADTDTAVLCSFERGRIADKNCFEHNFYFIADTDTEKYYFWIISAMNSDKRYSGKQKAHKLKKNPQDFLFFTVEKTDRKEQFCRDTGRVSQGRPAVQGGVRNSKWFLLTFLLPNYHARRKSVSQVLFRRGMI